MVRRIIWSASSKIDLFEILNYYFERNGNKTYSKKLNSDIRSSVKLLSSYPKLGIQTKTSNVRVLIEGRFGIFYRLKNHSIEIISLWDFHQNPDNVKHKK
ncbi:MULTISPECIES: type II toxin-antitoxin system RelE/ParE family toxin [unclassified Lentimicrobium]|uniref:type II toxin-antitoxin system RelE/ParE family toxin n=1 Tax=unclassified Lentimicrobium TaxID=2677434 RepID=UPI001551F1FB|nr:MULTISPECIES: type II toxin-antitoxin system RelE/ParE family toxin [unclassified Lentimicrobium]NPD47033.1 type II toxin-antitoxin system RelE/ParE family toxin [Lentimicrobium sp. S6]NPD84854.1 type II toxin-antitoxin system RelE/ParE family toxin [Lentimicrobium sp. L6]